MAENIWIGWKLLELVLISSSWMEMAKYGCKWLKTSGIDGNNLKWLDLAGNCWNGWNGWQWLAMAGNS